MRKILPVLLSIAPILALAPSNASPVSGPVSNSVDDEILDEGSGARLLLIRELWQRLPLELAEELQEYRASLDVEFATRLIPTGAVEPDWKSKGIDLSNFIASLPGGIDDNALLIAGEVPVLRFFGEIPADILADWEFIEAGPKATGPTEAKGGDFVAISPHHIVFVADDEIEMGNARCRKTAIERAADHATVYRYSGVPFNPDNDASLGAEAEAIVLYALIGNLRSPILCSTVRRGPDGEYRSMSYTPDGRPLGMMDDPNDRLEFISSIDLHQQLNGSFTAETAGDASPD